MAGWLAKEQDGKEVIFRCKPRRQIWYDRKNGKWTDEKTRYVSNNDFWGTERMCVEHPNTRIILPKGTIKKLIGKDLTWNDEPVKIK